MKLLQVASYFLGMLVALNCFQTAQGASFYTELGLGAAQYRGANTFFGTSFAENSNISLAGNFLVAENLMPSTATVQIHLGIKSHYLVGTQGSTMMTSNILYPILRFELPRFYVTFGVSPFVYKQVGGSLTFPTSRDSDDLAFLGEFGLLWRVVPFFHLALEASAHIVNNPTQGLSPMPALTTTLQMRFYAETPDDAKSKTAGNRPYDGWRYPFGISMH